MGTDTTPEAPTRWLTYREAAAYMRVSPSTLCRWAAAGRVVSHRTPGGDRRYLTADLDAAMRRDDA